MTNLLNYRRKDSKNGEENSDGKIYSIWEHPVLGQNSQTHSSTTYFVTIT
jgi:hypothetical protein